MDLQLQAVNKCYACYMVVSQCQIEGIARSHDKSKGRKY